MKIDLNEDRVRFKFEDGIYFDVSSQELYDLLMFVYELKNSRSKNERERDTKTGE